MQVPVETWKCLSHMSLLHWKNSVKSSTSSLTFPGTCVAVPLMVASLQEGRNNWLSVQIFIGQLFNKDVCSSLVILSHSQDCVQKHPHTLPQQFELLDFNKNKSPYFSCQRIQTWITQLSYLTSLSTRKCIQGESLQGYRIQEQGSSIFTVSSFLGNMTVYHWHFSLRKVTEMKIGSCTLCKQRK